TALHAKAITLHLRRCLRHYSGPFDDVPEFPTVVVRDRLFPHANDREVLYLRSAIAIIAYYLGRTFASQQIAAQGEYLQTQVVPGTNAVHMSNPTRILLIGRT